MQREDIIRILNGQQKTLADRYHVERLSLFGSVARGEAQDDIPPLINALEDILKQS
jgi:predicted nucleotidyltransferase